MQRHPRAVSPLFAAILLSALALPAMAQNAPQSNTVGDNSSLEQQVIGDTSSTADHTNSVSTQLGNSANANGATVSPTIDTRDQNTVTSTGGAATGGAATGNLSDNDNRSSVGNTSASNGPQTMGQANTGNSASNSGGNTLSNGSSSGGNTMTGGANTASNGPQTMTGGSQTVNGGTTYESTQNNIEGSRAGVGNSGNSAQGQGQQQGIAGSGNSDNANNVRGGDQRNTSANVNGQSSANRNTSANTNGQQQANTGTNAQGQSSRNAVRGGDQSLTGGAQANTSRTNVGGQNASTQSGVGQSGNSAVQLDASNRSVDNTKVDARSLFIPRITADTPPSMLAAGSMIQMADPTCGPLQSTKDSDVYGTESGWFFDNKVDLGKHQELAMFYDQDGKLVPFLQVTIPGGGLALIGHKVTTVAGIIGVAAGKNIALGGGGSNMNWGQAGAGNTSSMQRMVQHQVLRTCIYALPAQPAAAPILAPAPAPLPIIRAPAQ